MRALAARWQTTPKTALRRLRQFAKGRAGKVLIEIGTGRRRKYFTTVTALNRISDLLLEEHKVMRDDVESLKEWKLRAHAEIQRLRARVAQLEREKDDAA